MVKLGITKQVVKKIQYQNHPKFQTGRPKKKILTEQSNEVDTVDTPRYVNKTIDEFEIAVSNNHVVFNGGSRIELGSNSNKNNRGAKSGSSLVKLRGGKIKRGGLPTQRLRRMDIWLGVESEPYGSFPCRSNEINDDVNVAGTQQSEVVGDCVEGTSNGAPANQGSKVRQTKSVILSRTRQQRAATQRTNNVQLVDEPRQETR